jgi:secreted trypsin-like serine protease
MKHRIGLALVAGLFLGACVAEEDPDLDEVDQEVIGGADEPDYRYPWVVRVSSAESCGGVLIHPSWVLTARHCVSTFTTPSITFARTDAYSGDVIVEQRDGAINGVHVHPSTDLGHDIALIRLATPFVPSRYIQTVALPAAPQSVGTVGVVAAFRSDAQTPSGNLAVARGPIVDWSECSAYITELCVQDDDDALCNGDSGSGFTSNLGGGLTGNGRATVLGIASEVADGSCDPDDLGQSARLTDVYSHRTWIAQTTGLSLASLAGDARARWDGQPSRGLITVRCESSPYGFTTRTTVAPMNARGAEARLDCPAFNRMRVTCNLGGDPNAQLTSLRVTTTNLNGTVTTSTIQPSSTNSATYVSPFDMNGNIVRDVACRVGGVNVP